MKSVTIFRYSLTVCVSFFKVVSKYGRIFCSPIYLFSLLLLNSRVFLGMCVEEQTALAFSLLTSCCV